MHLSKQEMTLGIQKLLDEAEELARRGDAERVGGQ
jgi:hypothetical protein